MTSLSRANCTATLMAGIRVDLQIKTINWYVNLRTTKQSLISIDVTSSCCEHNLFLLFVAIYVLFVDVWWTTGFNLGYIGFESDSIVDIIYSTLRWHDTYDSLRTRCWHCSFVYAVCWEFDFLQKKEMNELIGYSLIDWAFDLFALWEKCNIKS